MEYVIDAAKQPLGRIASQVAVILQGKKNAAYNPRLPGTDRVVVKNISKVMVTGRKYTQKIYYRHTGYMGHLKETTFRQAFEKNPAQVMKKAVFNMLPKNRLRAKRLKRLVIE